MGNKDDVFLIVDDEPDMCWALVHILGKNGFSAKEASNGQEALTLVERNCFRLAFLDAKLPDVEGIELAKLIRKLDPSIHIVIVSGYFYRDDRDIQQALEEGLISGFIAKPFHNDEILKVIERVHPS